MITEGQYLDALKIVREYLKQIELEFDPKKKTEDDEMKSIFPQLTVRLCRCVERYWQCFVDPNVTLNNISLWHLNQISKRNFLRVRYVGMKSLIEVTKILAEHSLELKP